MEENKPVVTMDYESGHEDDFFEYKFWFISTFRVVTQ